MDTAQTLKALELQGPVSKTMSRLIRPALVAREGCKLVWGDWSAIEARVLPWLAGDRGEEVLDIFRMNDKDPSLPDIYEIEAGGVYNIDPVEIHLGRKDKSNPEKAKYYGDMRQVGKVDVLALGFGGGDGALDAMATTYGIVLDRDMRRELVYGWRRRNRWAVDFWAELQEAFMLAWQRPGNVYAAGRVAFVYHEHLLHGTMLCYMPCGRPIPFMNLRWSNVTFEDEETGEEVTEKKITYQKGYERGSIWHGILAENITQGFAASLLRDLLVRLERNEDSFYGWPVGHTHDEAITECWEEDTPAVREQLKDMMEYVPTFAEGLPLVAEITDGFWYTKQGD